MSRTSVNLVSQAMEYIGAPFGSKTQTSGDETPTPVPVLLPKEGYPWRIKLENIQTIDV